MTQMNADSSFLRKQESRNCPQKRAVFWTPDQVRGDGRRSQMLNVMSII